MHLLTFLQFMTYSIWSLKFENLSFESHSMLRIEEYIV